MRASKRRVKCLQSRFESLSLDGIGGIHMKFIPLFAIEFDTQPRNFGGARRSRSSSKKSAKKSSSKKSSRKKH